MNRLLTKRDKNGGSHRRSKSSELSSKPRPLSSSGFFQVFKPVEGAKEEKHDNKNIQKLKQKLVNNGIASLEDAQIEYALQTKYADGDLDRAYEILILFQDSLVGIVRPYNPNIHMLGAENREMVTCWLDSLLFAMFARLGSFEPILYKTFDDEPRRRLSTLIRLWVNMLRTGKLIQIDITQHLQEALAACGWPEAADICQNDTSEAFSFITEKLCLPLLTMEMDIFHEGGADSDDHKFINERLLEVAIPQGVEQEGSVKLEDCLEEHFNARVEVVRRLERRNTLQRSNTQASTTSGLSTVDEKGGYSHHVEVREVTDSLTDNSVPPSPVTPTSEPTVRGRAPSIIRHITIPDSLSEASSGNTYPSSVHNSLRKGSIRKEVLMPAWQFFRVVRPSSPAHFSYLVSSTLDSTTNKTVLIGNTAWYTADIPTNDAQVAAHFSSTRPVLGICLKRYAMTADGKPMRQNTAVDIPLQIALPHFIQDDKATDGGPLFGNFKLVLQSMVCHRGNSVHAGHYISIIRGTPKSRNDYTAEQRRHSSGSSPPEYNEDQWIRFDDLARERVDYVDIKEALIHEMPYLLFYQVQPLIDEDSEPRGRPPSYEDSAIGMTTVVQDATPIRSTYPDPFPQSPNPYFEGAVAIDGAAGQPSESRISFSDDVGRGRKSLIIPDSERRGSLACTDTSANSVAAVSAPVTPAEEGGQLPGRLSRAASRFSRSGASRSRPSSHVDESRISATLSRLTFTKGKDQPEVTVRVTSIDGNGDSIARPIADPEPEASSSNMHIKSDKKGKSRDKSKGPDGHLHRRHKSRSEGKDKSAAPDRECVLM